MLKRELPFLRSAYNYDRDKASDESGLDCSVEPSLTQQSFRDECDINVLVARFGLGAPLPQGMVPPVFGDFTGVDDYQSALNAIMAADERFMQMPAQVRSRFGNDPQQFVEFCSDENNRDEAVKLGLVLPKVVDLVKSGSDTISPPAKPVLP